ncbi:MAG: bifunctional hydroxymethylpyrimidine kinase/phosphomethylpyrimidine kinase [Verrucomicrobia bacterium]|nr:bifunctional hydroxymethylpyrimidine kinase/phosphomethylpyrimidine kinase [Verrucomicrobiota bacterium]
MNDNSSSSEGRPVVLTIAGSDSGGGAGIQADLKTFSALGVFGTSAITCVTAQNPDEVTAIVALEPEMVVKQIHTVCEGFPVRVAKTGMLYSAGIIKAVAAEDIVEGIAILVVDPVMVSTSGTRLLKEDAIEALCNDLLPKARVVTPNIQEAEILWGHAISSVEELKAAAREIGGKYDIACVVKGGHLDGDEVVDVLFDEGEEYVFTGARVKGAHTHGAGCTFASALAAFLAHRMLMSEAVARAKEYVAGAIEHAHQAGRHHPLDFFWNLRSLD